MSVRLPAAARREQILAIALNVFAREGYHGSSMNDVADAAGVTKPVLYQHFDSKRELYVALLEETGQRLVDLFTDATSDATGPHDQVHRGFTAYFRWVADDQSSFQLMFGGGSRRDDEFAETVQAVESKVADLIAPLIAADIDLEHGRNLAYGVIGLAESISRRLVQTGDTFDPDLIATQVADMVWSGLRGVHRV